MLYNKVKTLVFSPSIFHILKFFEYNRDLAKNDENFKKLLIWDLFHKIFGSVKEKHIVFIFGKFFYAEISSDPQNCP